MRAIAQILEGMHEHQCKILGLYELKASDLANKSFWDSLITIVVNCVCVDTMLEYLDVLTKRFGWYWSAHEWGGDRRDVSHILKWFTLKC
jgi:hypothetical protein